MSHPSEIILIDDDKLIQLSWKMKGSKKGIQVHTFYSVEEFITNKDHYPSSIFIYIDSDLGNGVRGEQRSKELFELGFCELYLTTGYENLSSDNFRWIKKIQNKKFPF